MPCATVTKEAPAAISNNPDEFVRSDDPVEAQLSDGFVFCRHGESLPGHARAVEWGSSELLQKAPADPANDGDGLAVADRLVAGPVRAFACWFAAPWDQGVVVGHALEAFALAGS